MQGTINEKELSNRETGGDGNDRMAELHKSIDDMAKRVYELQQKCFEILESTFRGEVIKLPIDIEKVAHTLGVVLEYTNLNLGGSEEIDQNIAQLCYELDQTGKIVWKIYVANDQEDESEGAYSNLQRYAIAYELGKTIVGGEACKQPSEMPREDIEIWNVNSVPYSLPRLYAGRESFEYEICAIFLLLPLHVFLKEFSVYVDDIIDYPILMDMWIKYLSDKTSIPSYQLINGYQYIKFCAYEFYQKSLNGEVDASDFLKLFR